MHFIKGEYGVPRRKGVPAGFEAVGQVVKAGKGGDGLIGKRVGFFGSASGAWADYAISEVSMCVPVIDQVRDEDAAALLVNPLTAIAMYEEAKADGNNCFIMTAAASQLCKLIAGLAKEDGTKVISVVRRDEHVESARWIVYGKLSPDNPALAQMGQFIFMDKKIEGFWLTKWMKVTSPEKLMQSGMKVQQMFASGNWQTDIAEKIPLKDAHAKLPEALSKMNTGKVMLVP
ncbi:Enoyl-[acyl-carrier-protein] reductase, mitochondrial [Nymphon striatum]|nr:Enoyl-[acyl-carrier-protein] reductase, mitochondrial [Nymphon striatum]